MEFLPANKQTEAYFTEFFKEKGLSDIVTFWKQQVWSGSMVWKRQLWSGSDRYGLEAGDMVWR